MLQNIILFQPEIVAIHSSLIWHGYMYVGRVVDNKSRTKKALDFMKIWPVPPIYYDGPETAPTRYMYVGSMIDDKSKTKKGSR